MKSKLIRYKSFGRVVYSVHANGGEVKVSKHSNDAEARTEANRLNAEMPMISTLTSREQDYLAAGRVGLLGEEWDG